MKKLGLLPGDMVNEDLDECEEEDENLKITHADGGVEPAQLDDADGPTDRPPTIFDQSILNMKITPLELQMIHDLRENGQACDSCPTSTIQDSYNASGSHETARGESGTKEPGNTNDIEPNGLKRGHPSTTTGDGLEQLRTKRQRLATPSSVSSPTGPTGV